MIKKWKEQILVFGLCFALLLGGSYAMYVHYDFSHSTDSKDYMELAKGNFNIDPLHRYRVIVPLAASTIAQPIKLFYEKLWIKRQGSDWPYRLGFYITNTFILSLAGMFLFYTCRLYGAQTWAGLIALLAFLTGRWAGYLAGLPLTDSLYMLCIVWTFYAAKKESAWLWMPVFLGLHAKESFVLFWPVILWIAKGQRLKISASLLLSGLSFWAMRYYIDTQLAGTFSLHSETVTDHLDNIRSNVLNLVSIKGLADLYGTFGLFTLVILWGLSSKARRRWLKLIDLNLWLLALIIGAHLVLSGENGRMFYFISPLFCVAIALILQQEKRLEHYFVQPSHASKS